QLAEAPILRFFDESGSHPQCSQAEQLIQRQFVIAERFQFIDIACADIEDGHREELFSRQAVVSQASHCGDKAAVRFESEMSDSLAVFEQPVEKDHAGLTLESELDVRVGVRVEAGERLKREIAARL